MSSESTCFQLQRDPSLISVAQVLVFNKNLFSSPQRVPRPSYPFPKTFGDLVKFLTPKKLKSLIENPYIAYLKVQVVSFNMNLIFSPQRVPRPGYPFRYKFGRSGKGLFSEKAKIRDRGSICSATKISSSNPQYEPFLFSVACSQTELPISGKIQEIRECVTHRKS